MIRLDPIELGRVQIRVERPKDGPARVELAVERPDTLMMLLQDRPRLDQALDQAGVPAAGRTLSFNLGDTQSGGTGGNRQEQNPGGQPEPRYPAGGWDQPPARDRRAAQAWARAGVDITA